jgi:hypothetical protein
MTEDEKEVSTQLPPRILHTCDPHEILLPSHKDLGTPCLQVVWKFDKRTYGDKPPPRNLEEPPPVVDNDLARLIVAMINEVRA